MAWILKSMGYIRISLIIDFMAIGAWQVRYFCSPSPKPRKLTISLLVQSGFLDASATFSLFDSSKSWWHACRLISQCVLIYHFSWFENVSREQSSCFYSSPACRAAIHMFVKLIVADETCMSQCPVFNKNTTLIVISCSTPIVHDIRNLFSSSKKIRFP